MKIRIAKPAYKIIGGLRVSQDVYHKLEKLAKEEKVSKQEIIRAILDEVIDTIEAIDTIEV